MQAHQYKLAQQEDIPLPNSLIDQPLRVVRHPKLESKYPELKDPTVFKHPSGFYMMYASIGNSYTQKWKIGRFVATDPRGTWTELSPTQIEGLCGSQLCAPAVYFDKKLAKPWQMYTQTACFEENGIIAHLESIDGKTFHMAGLSADAGSCKREGYPVVGVYDAGISTVLDGNEEALCMPFSGYRRVGCGDIYLTTKKGDETWSKPVKILDQSEVSFHNSPDSSDFEWGLEGIKIVQFKPDLFAMIGVAFLSGKRILGTRQRVFMASSDKLFGPYKAIGPLFNTEVGENGHPDMWVENETVYVIYQARLGDGKPWYFRWSTFNTGEFIQKLEANLQGSIHVSMFA